MNIFLLSNEKFLPEKFILHLKSEIIREEVLNKNFSIFFSFSQRPCLLEKCPCLERARAS